MVGPPRTPSESGDLQARFRGALFAFELGIKKLGAAAGETAEKLRGFRESHDGEGDGSAPKP
jgi:hypothetical protein